MIQECLINFAGERLRSRMTSHCEIILGFYLSASHPELNSGVKLSSPSQKWRAFPQNVRRTFHVPSGVRVQRSISGRDVSHPRTVSCFCFRILIGYLGILGLLHRRMVVVSHLFLHRRFLITRPVFFLRYDLSFVITINCEVRLTVIP